MQPNSQAIRNRRLAAGLTQTELAALAGVDRVTIGSIEQGKSAKPATLKKLAKAFRVKLSVIAELPELEPQAS